MVASTILSYNRLISVPHRNEKPSCCILKKNGHKSILLINKKFVNCKIQPCVGLAARANVSFQLVCFVSFRLVAPWPRHRSLLAGHPSGGGRGGGGGVMSDVTSNRIERSLIINHRKKDRTQPSVVCPARTDGRTSDPVGGYSYRASR